ncbi:MAG: nucleotidyl transferase AbiEii/AbiGii toxin family protein [Woeseia sp.]|jgi:predicted nucleotidyltransferase component of viral defense system|nr:nucleotidyl transferase AbiEii/AbiGii toxin family protein [Woeseia sp.]
MADKPRNSPASVRQRLLNIAREQDRVFEVVLVTYGLERLIYRLSISAHRDSFVLKGGMLVTLWIGDENRVTRDADFLGFGDASEDHLISVFSQIMRQPADDGLVYDIDRLTAEAIREAQQYGGIRLKTVANLGKTQIPVAIDIGFGDAMTTPDYTIEYPTLLDMPVASVRAYSPATVVAEKFHALVSLGLVNSRMKDYFDLWAILNILSIEASEIDAAMRATFERRETDVPAATPVGLTRQFSTDRLKVQQWSAYTASIGLEDLSLENATGLIRAILGPVCERLSR